jgi:hypothetical protein
MELELLFSPTETVTITIDGENYVVSIDEVRRDNPELYQTVMYYDNARKEAARLQYESRKLTAALTSLKNQVMMGTNAYVVEKYKLSKEESSEQGESDE